MMLKKLILASDIYNFTSYIHTGAWSVYAPRSQGIIFLLQSSVGSAK